MLYHVTITAVDEYEVDAPDEQAAIDLILEGNQHINHLGGYTDGIAKAKGE